MPKDQAELLQRIDIIRNNEYDVPDDYCEGYYKSKYDKQIETLGYELDDTINHLKRNRNRAI